MDRDCSEGNWYQYHWMVVAVDLLQRDFRHLQQLGLESRLLQLLQVLSLDLLFCWFAVFGMIITLLAFTEV